jgi:hypothetical protein
MFLRFPPTLVGEGPVVGLLLWTPLLGPNQSLLPRLAGSVVVAEAILERDLVVLHWSVISSESPANIGDLEPVETPHVSAAFVTPFSITASILWGDVPAISLTA